MTQKAQPIPASNAAKEIALLLKEPCVVINKTPTIAKAIAPTSVPLGLRLSMRHVANKMKIGERSCRIVAAPAELN